MKGEPVHGLLKIPDSELIKSLNFEIGILKSEIDELKFNNKKPKIHKHAANSQYIISLEGQVRNLKKKNEQLETKDDLPQLKDKIVHLTEKLMVSNRQVSLLQKELFKHAINGNTKE